MVVLGSPSPGGHLEAVVDGADPPARGAAPLQLPLPLVHRLKPVHLAVTATVAKKLLHL